MITLATLKKMSAVVSIRRLALACEMDPSTLRNRIRRNAPELTPDEVRLIKRILASAGLHLT